MRLQSRGRDGVSDGMTVYHKGPGPLLINNSQVHFLSLTNFLNDLCNAAVLNTNLNTKGGNANQYLKQGANKQNVIFK